MSLSHPFGSTAPRTPALAGRRAHSRLVRTLRWGLPALILALLGMLGGFVALQAVRAAAAKPKQAPTEIRMVEPHIVGRDDQGRAVDLSARLAVRADADMQLISLGSPVLVLGAGGPHPKTVSADRGLYDEASRMLRLQGHVRVDEAGVSTAAAKSALVDTRKGTVSGVAPVAAEGPMDQVRAGSYTASREGGAIVMHGGVHAVLKAR
ncbi:MAG: LPS export ABC transporter periplasmic protein LptC [Caulobacteraceae bacterium]